MPFCLDPKHAEAAVVVVEGDALYDAGDLIGRGSALWHGGVHDGGFNFATDGWGNALGSRSAAIWFAGEVRVGWGGSGVTEVTKSLLGHLGAAP